MALGNLTSDEMVEITNPLIQKENPARLAIEALPRARGLLPSLRAGHQSLLKVRRQVNDPRLAEITKAAGDADSMHDSMARGVHATLTSLSILEPNGDEYLSLRDELFEDGLKSTIQATFVGQAGNATQVRARLTPALQARLAAIPLPSGNLLDVTLDWLAAGDRLGQLEEERGRSVEPERDGPTIVAARSKWIAAMHVLRATANLDPVDPIFNKVVFGTLNLIEEKAEQRTAKRSAASVVPDASAERTVSDVAPSPRASAQSPAATKSG